VTDKRTTLERFAAAVTLAVGLPHPTVIYRAIMASTPDVDDGLRAASYDGDGRGGTSSSHPERMLERRNPEMFRDPDPKAITAPARRRNDRDDLIRLNRSTTTVLDAVAALNAECCDAGQPDTWDEAIHCANLLEQQGYLAAAIDVGRDVDAWAMRFVHAVDTVRAVHDSWMAHAPGQSIAEENDPWCQSHFRIGARTDRLTRKLCRFCWDQLADLEELGERVVLQEERANWPSEAMLRAHAEGRMVDLKRERTAWLKDRGLDPSRVHQRRQNRRSA
jgi:hypothetical protein